jgi:hypothetical protein
MPVSDGSGPSLRGLALGTADVAWVSRVVTVLKATTRETLPEPNGNLLLLL